MLGHDAKIYKDTYALSSYLFKITAKFQHDVKATLAKRIEDAVLDMADYIIAANLAMKDERARILGNDFVVVYERLRFLINLAVDRKQIGYRQHAEIARMMDEIGRQATAWRKSAMK